MESELQERLTALKIEIGRAERDLQTVLQALTEGQEALRHQESENKAYTASQESKRDVLEGEVTELEQRRSKAATQLQELRLTHENAETAFNRRVTEREKELSARERDVEAAADRNQAEEQRLTKLAADIMRWESNVKDQAHQLKAEQHAWAETVAGNEAHLTELNNEIYEKTNTAIAANERVHQLEDKLTTLQDSIREVTEAAAEDLERLTERSNKLTKRLMASYEKQERSKQSLDAREKLLDQKKADLDDQAKRIRSERAALKTAKTELKLV